MARSIPASAREAACLLTLSARNVHCAAQCKEFRVIRHRDTDRPRGCFITVESAEGVAKALTLDNTLLRGRPLRVDVAEAKPERNSGAFLIDVNAPVQEGAPGAS